MVKKQIKPLSSRQLGYGRKLSFCERKIYLRKEGLLSKYMPLLGFFTLYIYLPINTKNECKVVILLS